MLYWALNPDLKLEWRIKPEGPKYLKCARGFISPTCWAREYKIGGGVRLRAVGPKYWQLVKITDGLKVEMGIQIKVSYEKRGKGLASWGGI